MPFCIIPELLLMVQKSGDHQLIGKLPHLQGSVHPRWCRISSINSINSRTLVSLSGKTEQVDFWKNRGSDISLTLVKYSCKDVGDLLLFHWNENQLTVHWWFGARWFGIRIGVPLSNNPFHFRGSQESDSPGPKPPSQTIS